MGHWYCRGCAEKKDPTQVTFEENCDDCGAYVTFVDSMRGTLFSKPQGDYYELTGDKPIERISNQNGESVYMAPPAYVKYLESRYT